MRDAMVGHNIHAAKVHGTTRLSYHYASINVYCRSSGALRPDDADGVRAAALGAELPEGVHGARAPTPYTPLFTPPCIPCTHPYIAHTGQQQRTQLHCSFTLPITRALAPGVELQ